MISQNAKWGHAGFYMNRSSASFYFASFCKWIEVIEENAVVIRFLFSFEISIACWLLSRPNLRIVSKLTTDVVTYGYCTEASNQKSKYASRKIFFYKKALPNSLQRREKFRKLAVITDLKDDLHRALLWICDTSFLTNILKIKYNRNILEMHSN